LNIIWKSEKTENLL